MRQQIVISAILSMMVTGGFLIAFSMQGLYGGSMKYLDGSEKTLFDINIGVLGFGLAFILLIVAILLEVMQSKRAWKM